MMAVRSGKVVILNVECPVEFVGDMLVVTA
jgi:hypothetical protein